MAIKAILVAGHALSAGVALAMLPTLAGGLVAFGIALSFLHQVRRGFGVHGSGAIAASQTGRVLAPWLVILRPAPRSGVSDRYAEQQHKEGAVLAVRPSAPDALRRTRSALRWPDPAEVAPESAPEKADK